jgi:phosphohistidine phosphatase
MENPENRIPESQCLLYIIRHGQAAPKNAGLPDFERILTKTGARQCDRVAAASSTRLRPVDLVLSSPADRALETAHHFARHWAYPVRRIRIVEMLYAADSIRPLVAYIRGLGDVGPTVAVFGHNPLLDGLVAYFIPGYSGSIPKGAMLGIGFETARWASVSRGGGQLLFSNEP